MAFEPAIEGSAGFRYPPDPSIDEMVAAVEKKLQSSLMYWTVKRAVKEEIIKPKYKPTDIGTAIHSIMNEQGLATAVRNSVHALHMEAMANEPTPSNEPKPPVPQVGPDEELLDVVNAVRRTWQARVKERLAQRCLETGMPLMRVTSGDERDQREKRQQQQQLDTDQEEGEADRVTHIYEDSDLLEVIANLQHGNHSSQSTRIFGWGLVKVELKTHSITDLRRQFDDLAPDKRHMGCDDELKSWFAEERLRLGLKVTADGYTAQVQQFAKGGVPSSLRPPLWRRLVGVGELTEKDCHYFDMLVKEVDRVETVVDDCVRQDIRTTANDDNFFVFEEVLDLVMLAFLRDKWTLGHSQRLPMPPILGVSKSSKRPCGAFPPGGVLPFRGLALYACPLCFLYPQVEDVYFVFRAMWARMWCKLHTISSQPGTLLPLLKLFEDLLQITAPDLFYHMMQLGVHPTSISFPWILYAFVGYLEVDQVLLLWDRLLGFDSLEILPVLACAVFVFRSKVLLSCGSLEDVQDVFEDPSQLKIVPLIQDFLFSDLFDKEFRKS